MPNIESGIMKKVTDVDVLLLPGETYAVENGSHTGNSIVHVDSLAALTAATATENDIVSGYKGWSNGILRNGTLPLKESIVDYSSASISSDDEPIINVRFNKGAYINVSPDFNNPVIVVPEEKMNELGGLTEDKIAKGKVYGGITGKYTSDATATASDIKAGYIAYVNGERIVGTLKTQPIYSLSGLSTNKNSITISWNNPSIGPYAGVHIYMGLTPTDLTVANYTGIGTNGLANGRSSMTFNGLTPNTTYYFSIQSYCGSLDMPAVQSISVKTLLI